VNEDEFYKRLAQTMGERDQAMRDYLRVCEERDEARQRLADARSNIKRWARNHRQRNEARAKAERLRDALRKLLLSRDASWTGGHDWQEAVDGAITALGVEVSE
jgi:hypothetical protein